MMLRTLLTTLVGLGFVCMALPATADTWTDYSDIGPDLLGYQTTYPTLCQQYDLGLSVEGRHLWAIRISDNISTEEDEPGFKYIATMHGDEIVGTKMCMNLIDLLLTNYGTNDQLTNIVDKVDLWIVPLMNPDGYDRVSRTRNNASGINLNRDFPDLGDPNTTAGRAVETGVIMNWCFGESFTVSANFHGGALVTNYPFDNEDTGSRFTPDNNLFVHISEEYSQYNLPMWNSSTFYHGITNGADWYFIWGGMQDWNYHFMGCNEVTIELDNDKEPDASEIGAFWSENRESMLAYIETSLIGVRGLVTDASSGLPLDATITVVGRNHNIYTDPDVGDYHRMLLPGTYDLTFAASGYSSVLVEDVVVADGHPTYLDVAMGATPLITLGSPPLIASPNGGETLTTGMPTTISWSGGFAAARYHVQYSENYGEVSTINDGFESGSLGTAYTTGGDASWYVDTYPPNAHSGLRAARAGDVNDEEISWMERSAGPGPLSFWYRVDSEQDYDFFYFYIDGDPKLQASGSGVWTRYSTTLGAGDHVLRWEYDKDEGISYPDDTVWIDDIEVSADNTQWTDVIALTDAGTNSVAFTPPAASDSGAVRVRPYYERGTYYEGWDESDATFSVEDPAADGDYDDDTDVDLADFAAFQECFGGPATGACGDAFEFVVDGTIDLGDYPGFQVLLTGP